MELTKINPILTAIAVVNIYNDMVLVPILDSFLVSDSDATPVINEEITNGTAISFKRLRNIVPKGEMKSDVKPFQPFTALKIP
tara:strand:+ start:1031 stop:1279 length:249 start_codon:yes stop_codon:yes gene_type:complete